MDNHALHQDLAKATKRLHAAPTAAAGGAGAEKAYAAAYAALVRAGEARPLRRRYRP